MRSALWALVVAAITSYLVWSIGSAPWWVYAMLFARFFFEFAKALSDESAPPKASDDGESAGAPVTGAIAWQVSALPKD
jgi:hypothetical protein